MVKIVFLSLVKNSERLREYVSQNYRDDIITYYDIDDINISSTIKALTFFKGTDPDLFILGTGDLRTQQNIKFYKLLAILSGAKDMFFIDEKGNKSCFTRLSFLYSDTPCLIWELFFSLLGLVYLFILLRREEYLSRAREGMPPKKIDNAKNLNIAYLRTSFAFNTKIGGSIGHMAGVINGFLRTGNRVICFSTDQFLGLDNSNNISVNQIYPDTLFNTFPKIPLILYHLKFVRRILSYLSKLKDSSPDFFYQRYTPFNFSGITLSRILNIPIVIEFNSSEVWKTKHWEGKRPWLLNFMKRVEELNLKAADLVVVVSNVLRNDLLEQGLVEDNRILVNPNCVDTKKFFPSKKNNKLKEKLGIQFDKIIIGFAGTFHFWHGVSIIADTIKSLESNSTNKIADKIFFLLIGDGPKREEIEEKTKGNKNVILTGPVPYQVIEEYLNICDILISPHLSQLDGKDFFGSPTKMFEYMSMGKGIIASNIGQISEILTHNSTAWLIKPGSEYELYKAIIWLASDGTLRKRLGENARDIVLKKYTWEKNIQRVVERLCVC